MFHRHHHLDGPWHHIDADARGLKGMLISGRTKFKPGDVITSSKGLRLFIGSFHTPKKGWCYVWIVNGKKKEYRYPLPPKRYFATMMRYPKVDFVSKAK